ncbi:MAG: hypothetical protein ACOVVK_07180 [Elsteraceae bacterium]
MPNKATIPISAEAKLVHNERIKFLATLSERIGTGILLVGGFGSMVKLGYDNLAAHAANSSVTEPEFYFLFALASSAYAIILYLVGYKLLKKPKA